MKKVAFFAAVTAATALITSPVLAQDTAQPRAAAQAKAYKSSAHMKHSARMQSRDANYARVSSQDRRNDGRDWNNRNWDNNRGSGFWPAGVVGGAVGTAGAIASGAANTAGSIATAPFGGPYRDNYAYRADGYRTTGYRDSYAFGGQGYTDTYDYKGVAIPYSESYAARNGFTCQPGTVFRAANGQPTICQ